MRVKIFYLNPLISLFHSPNWSLFTTSAANYPPKIGAAVGGIHVSVSHSYENNFATNFVATTAKALTIRKQQQQQLTRGGSGANLICKWIALDQQDVN